MSNFKIQNLESSTILFAGYHLLEIEFKRPVSEDILQRALLSMGFENSIVDQSIIKQTPIIDIDAPKPIIELWRKWNEWGTPGYNSDAQIRYRFISELKNPIQIQNTNHINWIYQHQLSLNPFEDLEERFNPYELKSKKIYDIKFLARMRSQPTRIAICETLALMGFKPIKILALKRNMRIPGRPNTSITRWFALAQWDGPASYISSEDPLYFENVKEVNS